MNLAVVSMDDLAALIRKAVHDAVHPNNQTVTVYGSSVSEDARRVLTPLPANPAVFEDHPTRIRLAKRRKQGGWLSLPDVQARYRIGRKLWNEVIESGQLPASKRVFRGGHVGYIVREEDAERIFGARPMTMHGPGF
jgi:hypothetical protein